VEGEDTLDLFIVRRGSLVVERALPDGTQRALAHLVCSPEAPCIIGEMASLGAARRTATVRAVGSCHALHLQPAHLDAIIAGFPGLTRLLCRQFTLRLREAIDDLRDLRGRFELGAQRRMVQTGELIHGAGSPATELIQVAMGSIQIGSGEGARVLRPEDLPGGFLDLEAFLRGTPHGATATAAEPCFLAVIDADHRQAFVRSQPHLVLEVLRS
jgi:CRP-like cAMP-binding protein